PGSRSSADEVTTALSRNQAPGVLATLLRDSDRSRIIGQVAAMDVPSGDLIPAGVVGQQATGGMVRAELPIRLMPADLAAGDHVLLLVSGVAPNGAPVDIVYMQDVRVLRPGQGSAALRP